MSPDVNAYTAVMEEIKRRIAVVHALHNRELSVMYHAVQIETTVLQIRMILELIALASLAAHKQLFELNKKKFEAHWDPVRILKDVEKLNPHYYPKPIIEKPSDKPGVKNDLIDVKEGYLTKSELIEIHGRCGNVLHARNPYGKKLDYSEYANSIPGWTNRIMKLLNCHQVQLVNDKERFYLVHMKEDQDDKVHMYTFEVVDA